MEPGVNEMKGRENLNRDLSVARRPEDLAHLFVARANAGDADGLAALYEPDAVLAYPPGQVTQGRQAIRAIYAQMLTLGLNFKEEPQLPAIVLGDLALTSASRADGNGMRVQLAHRQPDGSWLRIIDRPEPPEAAHDPDRRVE